MLLKISYISRVSVLWALFIIISASFMRQLHSFVVELISRQGVGIILNVMLVSMFIAAVFCILRLRSHRRLLLVLLPIAAMAGLAYLMPMPEEKTHILKYALLGFLVSSHMFKSPNLNPKIAFLYAFQFGLVVSLLDEGFQAILPYRVGDLRDVFFDMLSLVSGIMIAAIAKLDHKTSDS
jgi:hypothetical protein